MNLSHVKAVVFDRDHTLIHPIAPMRHYEAIAARFQQPLERVTEVIDAFDTDYLTGRIKPLARMNAIAQALVGYKLASQVIDELLSIEFVKCLEPMRRYEGADELINRLKQAGYKLALCSNSNPIGEAIARTLRLTPELGPFDAAIFSCRVGVTKPDLKIYRQVCHSLKVPPSRCLYVGDGGGNGKEGGDELKGAKLAGMTTVLVRHTDGYAVTHPEAGITGDIEVKHVADVAQLLLPAPVN